MQITYVPEVPPRLNNAQLFQALSACEFDGGGNTMMVGIRNEAGKVCISVKTVGMAEFMNVIGCLQELKLTDELENATGMKDGFDAIFK